MEMLFCTDRTLTTYWRQKLKLLFGQVNYYYCCYVDYCFGVGGICINYRIKSHIACSINTSRDDMKWFKVASIYIENKRSRLLRSVNHFECVLCSQTSPDFNTSSVKVCQQNLNEMFLTLIHEPDQRTREQSGRKEMSRSDDQSLENFHIWTCFVFINFNVER